MLKLRNLTFVFLFLTMVSIVSVSAAETVLLEFSSSTCAGCRKIEPLIQELIQQGWPIRQIDAEQNRNLAAQFEITSFPTFIMLVDGYVVDRVNGTAEIPILRTRLLQMLESGRQQPQSQQISPQILPQTPIPSVQQVSATLPQVRQPDGIPTAMMPSMVLPDTSQSFQPLPLVASPNMSAAFPEMSAMLPENPFLKATVRLRVDGNQSHDWGTGTIIDARNGKALILTCGHIFHSSQGKGAIEIDLFSDRSLKKIKGELIQYNNALDIAFVMMTPPFPVSAVPLAPIDYSPHDGDFVSSTGCDGGAEPTLRQHRIQCVSCAASATNPSFYFIKVDNPPVRGRSGGGLFSQNGYLIGVCNLADQTDGFFAPLSVIRSEMDRAKLTAIYQFPSVGPAVVTSPVVAQEPSSFPSTTPSFLPDYPRPPALLPLSTSPQPPLFAQIPSVVSLPPMEQATLEELKRRLDDEAEIICIIRSKRDPNGPSDVIHLQSVSSQFVSALQELPNIPTTVSPNLSPNPNDPVIVAPSSMATSPRVQTSFPIPH